MPSNPSFPHSTRLENLSLDAQGAAFELEGRPIRLKAEGYAAPVASIQELYHHALADYYQRSAELSRQSAVQKPPLLGRLLSWVGRVLARLMPEPRSAMIFPPAPPPPPAPELRESPARAPRRESEPAQPSRETALEVTAPPNLVGPRAGRSPSFAEPESAPAFASSKTGRARKPDASHQGTMPPVLHVVFADHEGVHVIWQLAAAGRKPNPKGRDAADPKASQSRLELTYSLDSSMAQRLQDCYGQLAQLGYKITGLEAVRAAPEKSSGKKEPARLAPEPNIPASKPVTAESPASEPQKTAEPRPVPRKVRLEPVRVEAAKPSLEPPHRDPSFLPGI